MVRGVEERWWNRQQHDRRCLIVSALTGLACVAAIYIQIIVYETQIFETVIRKTDS